MTESKSWSLTTVLGWAALGVLAAAIIALLQPTTGPAREPARRAQCVNNLKQIALALFNYESIYGRLPPPYVAGPDGTPWHSWRVLILPFIEAEGSNLSNRYSFDEPWDGPNNIKLLTLMPASFACPAHFPWYGKAKPGETSYVAVTGPGTAFESPDGVTLQQFTDGPAQTILIAEATEAHIPWTSPRDLSLASMSFKINDPAKPSVSSQHAGGADVGLSDGSVRFLKATIPPATLRALITIGGGDGPIDGF